MKKREKKLRKILKSIDLSIMPKKLKRKIKKRFFLSHYNIIIDKYVEKLEKTDNSDLKKYII